MHYVVRLRADRAGALGVSDAEIMEVGDARAELQVRTWMQHAWADALHDRLYKTPLGPSAAVMRTGNLLAALMEEGDEKCQRMTHELDGMLANYTAMAPRADVEREIALQRVIL